MEDGKVLFTIPIDTVNPVDCLPQYFHYVHALGSPRYPYFAEGEISCRGGLLRVSLHPAGPGRMLAGRPPEVDFPRPGLSHADQRSHLRLWASGGCGRGMGIHRLLLLWGKLHGNRPEYEPPLRADIPGILPQSDYPGAGGRGAVAAGAALSGFESGRLFYELYAELVRPPPGRIRSKPTPWCERSGIWYGNS